MDFDNVTKLAIPVVMVLLVCATFFVPFMDCNGGGYSDRVVIVNNFTTWKSRTLRIDDATQSVTNSTHGIVHNGPLAGKDLVNNDPFDDFERTSYCRDRGTEPCIAVLSAFHRGCSLTTEVQQRSLQWKSTPASELTADCSDTLLGTRMLARHAYCRVHGCDVIFDYNQYNKKRVMPLLAQGRVQHGRMPPHWNKVASLRRWLQHYDAVLLVDMDIVIVDWAFDIKSMLASMSDEQGVCAPGIGQAQFQLFKANAWGHTTADIWWFYGTSPGCRYTKFPENYRSQSINFDMPWFWFALVRAAELKANISLACLDPCHTLGPRTWMIDCLNHALAKEHGIVQAVAKVDRNGYVNTSGLVEMNVELQFGGKSFDVHRTSLSIHKKDGPRMNTWLNLTRHQLNSMGCSAVECRQATINVERLKAVSDEEAAVWANYLAELEAEARSWGGQCAGLSNLTGVHHEKTWGNTTKRQRDWWLKHRCKT
eukprot:m.201940 g.201940  ORF g.201940 m.201940 type:complete len:481 (+) comp21637_c0_seq1:239-1681(+)